MAEENSTSNPTREPKEPDPEWVRFFKGNSIPITGTILIFLVLSLASHFGSETGWAKGKDITDVFLNIAQVMALLLAGWWFCFKYIRGRTYQESLIPGVSGRLINIGEKIYLVANIRVKNVGQSVVQFRPDASSLKVFEYIGSTSTEIIVVDDLKLAQFDPFEDLYIEPNEIIDTTQFIFIPTEVLLGLRLELEIISNHEKKYTWATSSVVLKSASNAIIEVADTDRKGES